MAAIYLHMQSDFQSVGAAGAHVPAIRPARSHFSGSSRSPRRSRRSPAFSAGLCDASRDPRARLAPARVVPCMVSHGRGSLGERYLILHWLRHCQRQCDRFETEETGDGWRRRLAETGGDVVKWHEQTSKMPLRE